MKKLLFLKKNKIDIMQNLTINPLVHYLKVAIVEV